MQHGPRVAVILVNYASYARQHLKECYASLVAQDIPRTPWALFIVDNASTPETSQTLRDTAPTARLLTTPDNLGWAGGNNTALRIALAEGFEYLVTLNMDTRLEPDWLRRLVEKAQRHPDLHILQSKMLLYGSDRINSLGGRIQYLGYGYCNGHGQPAADVNTLPAAIDFASGAALLVKREVFETIGLFRDAYFMYCEDMEFCWRARVAGFNVGLAEDSICYHKHDPARTLHSIRLVERNRWLTVLTLEQWPTLLILAPCRLVSAGIFWLFLCLRGRVDIPLRLAIYFLRPGTWRWIAARRREVGALRRRGDREIVGQFASAIFVSEAHPFLRTLMNRLFNPLLGACWAITRELIPR